MKRFFLLLALAATTQVSAFYAGAGFAWNTIDERYTSDLSVGEDISGQDRYDAHMNRLVPVVAVGHEFCLCNNWLIDISAEWKYLNYKTPNVSSSRGQILPNASFSSINIFGPEVIRDFSSKTNLKSEVVLLASLEKEVFHGQAYLGMGTALLDASNSIYVSSVHIPNGVGNHLISTSVKKQKILWGGVVKAGYKLYFGENTFLNIGYSYLQTGKYTFKNTANAATLNGSDTTGPVELSLKRELKFTVQEVIVSMNLIF